MNQSDIALLRLTNQHINGSKFTSPKEVVSWMGAMQAQDYPMAKWAIGVRLPGSTDQMVEAAINDAKIIRTHLLRPTWHFVAAEDVHWLLELTAPQIKASQRSRDRDLELTEKVYAQSNSVLEKALRDGGQLTRENLIAELNKANIATDQNRASHLFMQAELDGIICSGAIRNGKQTYALLAERVRKSKKISKEEALAELARRYFTSRCPATLKDFAWWSGLPARDATLALQLIKPELVSETIDESTYWLIPKSTSHASKHPSAYLLPTFDEFILSYSDRSASIPAHLEQHMKKISDRGVFRPIIVVKGQVMGIWKRMITKDALIVEILPFSPLDESVKDLINKVAHHFGSFLGKSVDVIY